MIKLTILLLLLSVSNVFAYTVEDNYIGGIYQNDTTYPYYVDSIGGSRYDILGMDVDYTSNNINVIVYSSFFDYYHNVSRYISPGDLFLSTDGYTPYSLGSEYDTYKTGESWEYAIVADFGYSAISGDAYLYEIDSDRDILLSDITYVGGYRPGQETKYNTINNTPVSFTASWSYVYDSSDIIGIQYTLTGDWYGLLDSDSLGLRWSMSCANDIIEDAIQVADESETFILLFVGIFMIFLYKIVENG